MRTAILGPLGEVSRLALGGGGIGQIWGETSREEAQATLHAALDAGITLLDAAPIYRNCEAFIGETFDGRLPDGVKITTKCYLGTPPPGETAARLTQSLEASLAAMRLSRADLFFLHSNLHLDGFAYAHGDDSKDRFSTSWSIYETEVVPAFEALKAQGRIGAWGITGIGVPTAVLRALDHTPAPDVVQAIANLMDSPGALKRYAEPARPRQIAATAKARGVGVMGIRAVQAGALTSAIDRELSANSLDRADYDRAQSFRALCARWGEDPAGVAHRYALSLPDIDTVVLGVKNRAELDQCVAAEAAGPLEPAQMAEIDALGLAPA
ncbi:MAG: aldo/keto reductase [Alphaproteobacteria bacterium]|nr:aldo/keto reductase [Alphaproteobacteria bacterium]MBU1513816.1 aldo/keto reductase [Alphaproteobacteria bacterium]MBU2094539.1 aldo/keto reductase [Alphaproteobacteria bacterium]MBU2151261.1 aldo/keto reductase [Alphaproteobacteria bacterium]MBU2305534.1 aldo/keto reductase [Alphaproteobacteria bacterium]